MKIYDVSLEVREGMIVYPGNPEPEIKFVKTIPPHHAVESTIYMGAHTGTHVDAGLHGRRGGWMITGLEPGKLVGKCVVLDLTGVDVAITENDLKKFGKKIKKGVIVVLKTKNSARGYKKFNPKFVHLSLDGAKYLARRKVKAVAIDYLGIQKLHSGNMLVHNALLEKGIPIVEGLNLKGVPAGEYFFVGAPVKIKAEAAPARVLLIKF